MQRYLANQRPSSQELFAPPFSILKIRSHDGTVCIRCPRSYSDHDMQLQISLSHTHCGHVMQKVWIIDFVIKIKIEEVFLGALMGLIGQQSSWLPMYRADTGLSPPKALNLQPFFRKQHQISSLCRVQVPHFRADVSPSSTMPTSSMRPKTKSDGSLVQWYQVRVILPSSASVTGWRDAQTEKTS